MRLFKLKTNKSKRVNRTGRNRFERYVRLFHYELNSPAYRSLSVYARALLIEMRAKFNGQNNGEIIMSVRQAADALGCCKDTAHKALNELQEKGFIRISQRGSFHWKGGLATTWVLTNEPLGDHLPTKEYMRWRPPGEIQNPVPRDRTIGPKSSDRARSRSAPNPGSGPTSSDREVPMLSNHGPTSADTYSLPGEPDATAEQDYLPIPDFLDWLRKPLP